MAFTATIIRAMAAKKRFESKDSFENQPLTCIGGLGDIGPAGVGDGVEVLGHASQLRFTGHFREVWVGVLK